MDISNSADFTTLFDVILSVFKHILFTYLKLMDITQSIFVIFDLYLEILKLIYNIDYIELVYLSTTILISIFSYQNPLWTSAHFKQNR